MGIRNTATLHHPPRGPCGATPMQARRVADTTLYDALGVSPDASDEDIRRAYRRMAMRHHPDKNPNNRDEAEEAFKLVAHAYEVLGDERSRQVYDVYGLEGVAGERDAGGAGGSYRHGADPFAGTRDPFEIFQAFFGGRDPFASFFDEGFGSPFGGPMFAQTPLSASPFSAAFGGAGGFGGGFGGGG